MSPLDASIFAWLLVASLAAVAAHLYALHHTPKEAARERNIHQAAAILAAFYGVGYVAVLCGAVQVLPWSQFFRGVSLLAFPLVWIYPAIMAGQRWKHDTMAARRLVTLARERVPERVHDAHRD